MMTMMMVASEQEGFTCIMPIQSKVVVAFFDRQKEIAGSLLAYSRHSIIVTSTGERLLHRLLQLA